MKPLPLPIPVDQAEQLLDLACEVGPRTDAQQDALLTLARLVETAGVRGAVDRVNATLAQLEPF